VIVVCGSLEPTWRNDGPAFAISARAVTAGATVQVIGIVPDGADGDRILIGLATAGIGHAAVLRTAPRALEQADVELALRYLPDVRVVIAVGATEPLLSSLADGAAFSGATLVVVSGPENEAAAPNLPESAIVLEAPADDPDETFAGFVGAFAARLDRSEKPADAWDATLRELAVDAVTPAPGRRDRKAAP